MNHPTRPFLLSCCIAACVAVAAPAARAAEPRPGETVITSDRLEFEYNESVILFEENVHVKDPDFEITADRVLVFLDGTNDVKMVRAMGNVEMTSEDRSATCSQAVYTHADGKIVLTGNDAMLRRGDDKIWGKQITIWVNDERMECYPARVVLPSVKKDPKP
ncbi:MAG: LptA/OstA family protein [Kiritimatiellia bacterium]|jgi:lipopolysaccharide transport protein LptA